jgi:hypothetical protein
MADDWGDELSVIDAVTSDDFGVPSNLMGRHHDDFFAILGRIVALCATVENHVLVFYQYLVGRRQDEFTELGVGKLITLARKELHRLPAPGDRELAHEFLDKAEAITRKRNDYVHNLWPAQPGGRTFGWRVPQKKNAKETVTTVGSIDELRDDLRTLVDFLEVSYQHRILGLISSGHHLDS